MEPTKSTLPYAIYCRKSSESEERQVLSVESQLKEIQALARRLGLSVIETITEAQSAKYPGRSGFNLLVEKIQKGKLQGILTWKLDRLARNPVDGGALIWLLDQGILTEILTPHNSFRNNSNDKFLMQIEFGMAKKYVDDLSDNVKRGNRTKLEKGWLPGLPPLGYMNDPKTRTIIPDPDRFEAVRRLWDLLLEGQAPSRIHEMVRTELLLRSRTRRNSSENEYPTLSSLYRMFTNPFYYGLIKRKEGVFLGCHQRMISEDEFWRVQSLLGHKGQPRAKTKSFAFTGMIRCGECGCRITAEEKENRYGYHYTYYHCTKRKPNRYCSQRSVSLEELERQVLGYLDGIQIPTEILELALNFLRHDEDNAADKAKMVLITREKAMATCTRKLEALTQMRLNNLIDDEEYLREKRKLLEEKIKLDKYIRGTSEMTRLINDKTVATFQFAHESIEAFKQGSVERKRAILLGIGSNLLLTDKKLFIDVDKPFLIIRDAIRQVTTNNGRFEPRRIESGIDEYSPPVHVTRFWQALVHDVRTCHVLRLKQEATSEDYRGYRIVA